MAKAMKCLFKQRLGSMSDVYSKLCGKKSGTFCMSIHLPDGIAGNTIQSMACFIRLIIIIH